MTDQQIANFILHRAKTNGQQVGLANPKLVIYKRGTSNMFAAVRFENHDEPFMLRFTRGDTRGIFKLRIDHPDYRAWKLGLDKSHNDKFEYEVDYDLSHLPGCVKHYVSYAIIEALKTKGVGFDLFSISYNKGDPLLVDPNETYEEAAIETDLLDFEMSELTSPIGL